MDFSELRGKILKRIDGGVGDERITFTTDSDEIYCLFHTQDCCESVRVEDIIGNLDDLIGFPILLAEVVSYLNESPDGLKDDRADERYEWTFYKLATVKGYVTIRWYGSSNGYYSTEVSFSGY